MFRKKIVLLLLVIVSMATGCATGGPKKPVTVLKNVEPVYALNSEKNVSLAVGKIYFTGFRKELFKAGQIVLVEDTSGEEYKISIGKEPFIPFTELQMLRRSLWAEREMYLYFFVELPPGEYVVKEVSMGWQIYWPVMHFSIPETNKAYYIGTIQVEPAEKIGFATYQISVKTSVIDEYKEALNVFKQECPLVKQDLKPHLIERRRIYNHFSIESTDFTHPAVLNYLDNLSLRLNEESLFHYSTLKQGDIYCDVQINKMGELSKVILNEEKSAPHKILQEKTQTSLKKLKKLGELPPEAGADELNLRVVNHFLLVTEEQAIRHSESWRQYAIKTQKKLLDLFQENKELGTGQVYLKFIIAADGSVLEYDFMKEKTKLSKEQKEIIKEILDKNKTLDPLPAPPDFIKTDKRRLLQVFVKF